MKNKTFEIKRLKVVKKTIKQPQTFDDIFENIKIIVNENKRLKRIIKKKCNEM